MPIEFVLCRHKADHTLTHEIAVKSLRRWPDWEPVPDGEPAEPSAPSREAAKVTEAARVERSGAADGGPGADGDAVPEPARTSKTTKPRKD